MSGRRVWRVAEQDRPRARALADACGLPPIVAHLLLQRGVESPDAARDFLRPRLELLSDPFLLTDMDAAVARITAARAAGEKTLVFGDYDVDGIASCAILEKGLRRFGVEAVECAMPLRLSEGYGLSPEHVAQAKAGGAALIITVDNGIKAHAAAAAARELGVDLIVTDHHAIDGPLPEAAAVVNPKRESPGYPGWHLCGAGVAFKLCTALNGTPNDLDLAAIGTVADIVPLLGENRVIVALGLRHLAKHQRLGMAQLAAAARIPIEEIRAEHIAFQLGPRLNAAGRLDDALLGLDLMRCEDAKRAARIAGELDAANQERRAIENAILAEATAELEAALRPEQRGIVLARRGWHSGVIGIVAARLQQRYARPAVLIAIGGDGIGKGSARGGPRFDMHAGLVACADLLVQFGGHKAAAGLTIAEERIPAFQEAFEAEALRQLGEGELITEIAVDALAALSEIDAELLHALSLLEPLGARNPAPVLGCLGVEALPGSVRVLREAHLRLQVREGGRDFPAIGFGMGEWAEKLPADGRVDIAFTPKFNTWNGATSIQLELKDIRPAGA